MNKSKQDSFFSNISKNKPCFYIWRVEDIQLINVSKDYHGIFFKMDVYLVYSCTETINKSISQHIHLWIGAESSEENQAIGAFKMIELDEYLNNSPIQHRECQSYETERFLSYFKLQGGIKYLNGGWTTGDHYYEKEFRSRLFKVRGKRLVRLNELKNFDWSSLNRNESFLIDLNTVVFIWNGRNTNKIDKLQLLNKIKILRNDKNFNIMIIEDGEEKDLAKEELKLFETYFPLKDKIKKLKNESFNDYMDDYKLERDVPSNLKLYKCSYGQEDDGDMIKIKIIEQKQTPIYRDDLTSEDSFIIDNGKSGIYVWSGRKCNPKERQEAMRNALGFLQAKGYDERIQNAIKVTCINEAFEPIEFRALFSRWSDSKYLINSNTNKSVKFEASILHVNPQLAAELQMIDDGSGSKKIWLISNSNISLLQDSKHGQFNSSNCYVIEYKYLVNGIDKYIIFYWIGRKSTTESQNNVLFKVIETEKRLNTNNHCHIVRIYQEKETKQFMAIFDGRIIIFQENSNELTDNYMLQVKNYGHLNIKAIQVEFKACSLNSNNVFIVCSNLNYYIWCGKSSTGDERQTAKLIINNSRKEPDIVVESQEKEIFWQAIGGKDDYITPKRLPNLVQSVQIVRLFEVLSENSKLITQEIFDFGQEDLNTNEIMILDIWNALFIWIGSSSNKKDIQDLDKIIKEYFKNDPCQRLTDTPVFKIRQSFEPVYFTGFFNAWNDNLFEINLTYNELKQELISKNQANLLDSAIQSLIKATNEAKKSTLIDLNKYPKYTYDELIKPIDELPQDVNSTIKEVYLNDTDFKKIFNMTFEEFRQKPSWKQMQLKRSAYLF